MDKSTEVKVLGMTQLVAGLLASGHYTHPPIQDSQRPENRKPWLITGIREGGGVVVAPLAVVHAEELFKAITASIDMKRVSTP